jgi:hypothetical protein
MIKFAAVGRVPQRQAREFPGACPTRSCRFTGLRVMRPGIVERPLYDADTKYHRQR